MLADIEALSKSGEDYSQFLVSYTLKNIFPNLVDSPGMTAQGHRMSIDHLYQMFTGKTAVVEKLQGLLGSGKFASEFDTLKGNILQAREKYFFSEAELNGWAYYLLQQLKQVEDAARLFELIVELFPASWNAYDSLAEACYAKGAKQKALEFYRKSLELNPANENGKKFVELIEKELAK
jgi:tetratricopeptide (TPR) repeat protein